MTLREIAAYQEGISAAAADRLQFAYWHAWHGAALARANRLPDLRQSLASFAPRPAAPMRDQVAALISAMRSDAASRGWREAAS